MSLQELISKFEHRQRYDQHTECLEKHLTAYFADAEISVFHELLSLDFHLDVYLIQPKNSNFKALVTSGMSTYAMTVEEEIENRQEYFFAELMVLLPKDMDLGEVHTGSEKNGWVLSMLKETARFPHHYDTFISIGHTVLATHDVQPYSPETDFVGCVVLPSVTFNSALTEFKCGENTISLYSLFPLYKDELAYKLEHGFNGLVGVLNKANAAEIINHKRKSMVGKKGFRGLF